MKLLYFAFLKLKQKVHLNIIVFLEIFVAMLFVSYVFGLFENCYEPIKQLSKIDTTKKEMYYTAYEYSDDRELYKKIINECNNNNSVNSVGSTYFAVADFIKVRMSKDEQKKLLKLSNPITGEYEEYVYEGITQIDTTSLIYDEVVAETLPLPLSKGKQMYEADNKDTVPVILNYKLRKVFDVGSEFTVRIRWESNVENNEDGSAVIRYDNYKDIKVKVCGFLTSENMYYDLRTVAENSSADAFLRKNMSEDMILMRTDNNALSDIPMELIDLEAPTGYLIELNESDTKSPKKLYADLGNKGSFSDFKYTVSKSLENFRNSAKEPFAIFIIFMLIAVISISSINELIHITQKKDFAVYYVCGAKWYSCLLIDLIRSFALIVIPSLIACVVAKFTFGHYENIILDSTAVYVVLVADLIIYALTSLGYNIGLIRTKPIKYIREME